MSILSSENKKEAILNSIDSSEIHHTFEKPTGWTKLYKEKIKINKASLENMRNNKIK